MNDEEISTKEKIINAIFSLLQQEAFEKISLSKIAKEIGISKTAIYRHFKSKDAIDEEIQSRIENCVYDLISKIRPFYLIHDFKNCFNYVMDFVKNHPDYLNYALLSSPKVGQDAPFYKLCQKNIHPFCDVYNDDYTIKNFNLYIVMMYSSGCLIDFLLSYFGFNHCKKEKDISFEVWKEAVFKILMYGISLSGNSEAGSQLSENEFKQIDELCENSMKNLPSLDKKLVALSNVIYKVGFPNVTIEAVANELGMAKSSLYSWFDDKKQMMVSLISAEITSMISLIAQNLENLKNIHQKIYALLKTEMLYFSEREETLTVCKWLQLSTNMHSNKKSPDLIDPEVSERFSSALYGDAVFENHIKNQFPVFDKELIAGWMFSFPVFLIINGKQHEFSKNLMNESLRRIYFMILEGLNNEKGN